MKYSGIGFQAVFMMLLCWWLGEKIELKGYINEPWGQLIGLMMGMFATIYHLIKSVTKN